MKVDKIRILVISYLPWRNDVSVGNTLSNLFDGMHDKVEFSNIFFKGNYPDNNVASNYFYISERQLAKSIISRKPVGSQIIISEHSKDHVNQVEESKAYNKARQLRWESLLLAQDLVGVLGNWKSKELDDFILNTQPQLIFGPLGRVPVANILMAYLHKKYNIPLITYAWDDHYSLNKKSFSLFFWLKTFLERKYIKRCALESTIIYTITKEMQQEYSGYFQKKCKLLYKGYDFDSKNINSNILHEPISIIYMGNIGSGRWKELVRLIDVLKKINSTECKAFLKIYTMSPKSKKMNNCLSVKGVSQLMKPVPSEVVLETMASADILLHVEPRRKRDLQFFRLSFSTKIVDYLYSGKCILAIGGNTAAMDYLKSNDAAVVIDNMEDYETKIRYLLNNKDMILKYGKNAFDCGMRNHQKSVIQGKLMDDFLSVIIK